MLDVVLITALGDEFRLSGTQQDSAVLSPYGSLVQLQADAQRTDMDIPGEPGVLPGDRRFGPVKAELEFFVHADTGEELESVYRKLRQGWRVATRESPCVLRLDTDHPLSPLTYSLVVDGVMPGVPVDMRRRTSETLTVPVVDVRGMARSGTLTGTGIVTVTNSGDGSIWPRIRYSGAGGVVTTPSGAKFTLPAAAAETVVDTNPRRLRLPGVFPESVPAGQSGEWSLPSGATLEWELLVADPWA